MKKSFILVVAMCLIVQTVKAQEGVVANEVSAQTADGKQIVAIAKCEQQQEGRPKNTIEVFVQNQKDNADAGQTAARSSEEVSIIGIQNPDDDEFYKEVDFEVHGVVQSCNPEDHYIICGSISRFSTDAVVGMVAILNSQLELVSLRRYPEVSVFYDVYAQDGFYFVCGQMNQVSILNRPAIVLRDNIFSPSTYANIVAFCTRDYPNCAFHEIALKKVPNQDCPIELSVSVAGKTVSFTLSHFEPIDNPLSVVRTYFEGLDVFPLITKKIQL